MSNEYIYEEKKVTATPRSKRLLQSGSFVTEIVEQTGATSGNGSSGHTHANKSDLDKLSVQDGYVMIQDDASKNKTKAGIADEAKTLTDDSDVWAKLQALFINKIDDDTAQGLITFLKGIVVGTTGSKIDEKGNAILNTIQSIVYSKDSEGFLLERDESGNYTLNLKNLYVWGKMIIHELEIRRLSAVGGAWTLSPCSSTIIKVEPIDATGNIVTGTEAISNTTTLSNDTYINDGGVLTGILDTLVAGWRCYYKRDDGTARTQNGWKPGYQAKSQTFNLQEGVYTDVSNGFYWRTVTEVSDAIDDKGCGYIVLSNDAKYMMAGCTVPKVNDVIVLDGVNKDYYDNVLEYTEEYAADKTNLQAGDPTHKNFPWDRSNTVILDASGNFGIIEIIDHVTDFTHPESAKSVEIGRKRVRFQSDMFEWKTAENTYLPPVVDYGNYDATKSYPYYARVSYTENGGKKQLYLCNGAKAQLDSDNDGKRDGAPLGTQPTNSDYWTLQVTAGEDGKSTIDVQLEVVSGSTLYKDGDAKIATLRVTAMQGEIDVTDKYNISWTRYNPINSSVVQDDADKSWIPTYNTDTAGNAIQREILVSGADIDVDMAQIGVTLEIKD